MSSEQKLEIQEDRDFQERFWKAERVAWAAFGLIILAGALGFLGSGGLFARGSVKAGDSGLEYPRVARWQTGERILVSFGPRATDERRVLLSRRFAETFTLEDAQPRPLRAQTSASGELLIFSVKAGETGEAALRVKPNSPGFVQAVLTIDDNPASATIFVLP